MEQASGARVPTGEVSLLPSPLEEASDGVPRSPRIQPLDRNVVRVGGGTNSPPACCLLSFLSFLPRSWTLSVLK